MTRVAKTGALVAGAALLLTACSGGGERTANPAPSSSAPGTSATSSGSTTALPYAGAPKVANPLPASVLSGAPCDTALTPEQVKQAIGIQVPGKPGDLGGVGLTCAWANEDTLGQIFVGFVTETHAGLSGVYENTKPKNPVWRPLPDIQGFPAVAHSNNTDRDCAVSVGLADDLSVDVSGIVGDSKRGKVDSCDVAAQMADLVVTTLKKRAGA